MSRLIDKHERIESIAASLRASGGTEEQLEEVEEYAKEINKKVGVSGDGNDDSTWKGSSEENTIETW